MTGLASKTNSPDFSRGLFDSDQRFASAPGVASIIVSCPKQPHTRVETDMTKAATKVPVIKETEVTTVPEEVKGGEQPTSSHEWWMFANLRRDIERAFEDFQRGPWRLPFTRTIFDVAPVWPGEWMWRAVPAVDIIERNDGYVIRAELPGIDAADIEVSLSDDRLTIAGEKREEKEEHRREMHLSELHYGSFQRTFRVPESVEASKIDASFRNGVLTVTLPKTAEAKSSKSKIEVHAA
jgi:HSP20 family protein